MILAKPFEELFWGRLKQLFLYITDECSLRCEQCLYKTTLGHIHLPQDVASWFINWAHAAGATKLTFIGGEPTMYGRERRNEPLYQLIAEAASVGYEYVRLDTNGLFSPTFLADGRIRFLSNIAFSLDGDAAEIHDSLRGKGTFNKTVRRLQDAVACGLFTTITTCVHPNNISRLAQMVGLAIELGARELNFHPLFKMGIARDGFSGNTDIAPADWLNAYEQLEDLRVRYEGCLHIRAPRRFVPVEHYQLMPEAFDYCPSRLGERMLVHPNGDIRICALCIGTPLRVAQWSHDHIAMEEESPELSKERLRRQPCMSQTRDFGGLVPLCISFKEGQQEHVWKTMRF